MRKRCMGLILIFMLLLSACQMAVTSSQTQSLSSTVVSSKVESAPSTNKTSSVPLASSQSASSANSASSTVGNWEESFNPAMDWQFNRYKNVNVNADLSVLTDKVIAQIASSNATTYLRTTNGELYSIGNNQYKELGQNTYQYLYGLQQVNLPESIKQIYSGNTGALAVGESNTLYLWGRVTVWPYMDENEQQLINNLGSNVIAVPFDQEIVQASFQCGKITLLTADGMAYAFGDAYEMGHLTESKGLDGYHWKIENLLVPQKIELPEKIVQAEATEHAMFWLGESGTVYTAYNKTMLDFPCEPLPENPYARKILFNQKVTDITVGLANLFMKTQSGDIYALGANWPEVLSTNTTQDNNGFEGYYYWVLKKPTKVMTDFPIERVIGLVGRGTVLYQAKDGSVYAMGENRRNDLIVKPKDGEDLDQGSYYHEELARLDIPKVSEFYARGNTYYFRNAADGKIYTVGYNMYGEAVGAQRSFEGDEPIQRTPVEVPLQFAEDFKLMP